MLRILCARYPKVRFMVCADGAYRKYFEDIHNLEYYALQDSKVQKWNFFWRKVKKTEGGFRKMLIRTSYATVHIGGSVFVQHFDDYSAFYNEDALLRRLSKRMYVVGANFGPYSDEEYYKKYYRLLSSYDGVVFRDTYSKKLFRDLSNVHYAPDVVFNYRPVHADGILPKKQVLISVIRLEGRDNKFSISKYAEVYKNFIRKISSAYIGQGYYVKYISFCEMQQDELAIEEIRQMLNEDERKQTGCCLYRGNLKACMEVFDESEIIVGTRFHSIILAELKGKKVIPIVYDKKTLHTMEDHGIRHYLRLEELESADVNEVMRNAGQIPEESRKALLKGAGKQFAYLDKAFR